MAVSTYNIAFYDEHKKTTSQIVVLHYDGLLKRIMDEFNVISQHEQQQWLTEFFASNRFGFNQKSAIASLMNFYPVCREWGYVNWKPEGILLTIQSYPFTLDDCELTSKNTKITAPFVYEVLCYGSSWGISLDVKTRFVNTLHPEVMTLELLADLLAKTRFRRLLSPRDRGILLSHARRLLDLDDSFPDSWVMRVLTPAKELT